MYQNLLDASRASPYLECVHKRSCMMLDDDEEEQEENEIDGAEEGTKKKEDEKDFEIDVGIGHAPDGGKKTKLYEDMFPVETKRFGYETEKKKLSREEALDIRVKKKADRYCK